MAHPFSFGGVDFMDGSTVAKRQKQAQSGAMKLQLQDVALFIRIAELGSLSAAARMASR